MLFVSMTLPALPIKLPMFPVPNLTYPLAFRLNIKAMTLILTAIPSQFGRVHTVFYDPGWWGSPRGTMSDA